MKTEEYTQAQRELSEIGPLADQVEQLQALRQEVRGGQHARGSLPLFEPAGGMGCFLLPAPTILKPAEARWASSLPAALSCASPAAVQARLRCTGRAGVLRCAPAARMCAAAG